MRLSRVKPAVGFHLELQYRSRVTPFAAYGRDVFSDCCIHVSIPQKGNPFAATGNTVEQTEWHRFQYRSRVTPFAAAEKYETEMLDKMFQYRSRVSPFAASLHLHGCDRSRRVSIPQ